MECDADDWPEPRRGWIAELARDPASGILGLIASCRPESDAGFEAWLDEGAVLGVVGYRRILHETTDEVSQTDDLQAPTSRKIGARGLPFDMCFLARQLPVALELARACEGTAWCWTTAGCRTSPAGGLDPWRAASGRWRRCRT